jgi:predicted nucleic acid-binding protein
VSVFVDTSALLALLDADDSEHGAAIAAWRELAEEGAALVSSNYVVVETTAVAQHRLGLDAVRALVRDVLPLIEIAFIDSTIHEAAVAALLAARRRQLSLVDCTSFELMRRREVGRAFAFDRHFREQKLTLRG